MSKHSNFFIVLLLCGCIDRRTDNFNINILNLLLQTTANRQCSLAKKRQYNANKHADNKIINNITYLSIAAGLNHSHNEILGCHEWQLVGNMAANNFRINNHSLGHILQGLQNGISC